MPVLLVDDDESVVSGLQALLSLEDIPAVIATDAESAEKMIGDRFYTAVVADVRLRSHDDGLRLIETIRRISPGSGVAAMTGYATPAIEHRLVEIGAPMLLRKPFDGSLFLSAVRTLRPDMDRLYRETTPRIRAAVRRRYHLTAEQSDDVMQEAWCTLLEKRQFVRDAGAWLTGTAMNLSRQTIERAVRERPAQGSEADEHGYTSGTESTLAMRRALGRIDERSRALCTLIGLEELSYAEVSDRLDIPIGSIGPLYIRAKQKLKQQLEC